MTTNRTQSSTRLLRLAVVALLFVSLLSIAAQPVSADDPPIQISTDVSPEEPVVDETVSIETTISNIESDENRNVDIRTVYLRQPGTANTYDRFSNVGTIGSGGSISVPLSTTFDSVGRKEIELRVSAQYSDGDGSISQYTYPVYVDVTESDLRGDIRLTSTDVSGGNSVTIQGDASNIGGTDVQSVLLSLNATESVSPAPPNREYFVGGIKASEFGTFELTADIEPETDSIPVDITYIVTGPGGDDERVTKTQQIAVDTSSLSTATDTPQAATSDSKPATGVPLLGVGIVVAVLAISVGGVVLWRRQ